MAFFRGDVRRLGDDLKLVRPNYLCVVPRVINRVYAQVLYSFSLVLTASAVSLDPLSTYSIILADNALTASHRSVSADFYSHSHPSV